MMIGPKRGSGTTFSRRRVLCLGVVVLLLVLTSAVQAAAPEKQRQLVYGGNVWNGRDIVSTFYPQSVRTIYLLAGATSILTARETLVYYWPADNQYRADWESLNEVVTGTLEITGRDDVQRIEQTPYVVQYPQGQNGPSVIYTGDEAVARYRAFQQARDTFNEAVRLYYEAERAYQSALDEANQHRAKGESVVLPQPPQRPDEFVWLSTPPNPGFAINLEAGDYSIRLLDSNSLPVPGSERRLHIFAAREMGVSYILVPETRWTVPERSADTAQVVYGRPGTIVYAQPMQAMLVNDLAYTRLEDPQSRDGREDRERWVDIVPLNGLTLWVDVAGQQRVVNQEPFTVRQLPGAALGYEVVPYDAGSGQPPQIVGYRLVIGDGSFHLLDQEGRLVRRSERIMRPARALHWLELVSLVLLPLVLGMWIAGSRKPGFSKYKTIMRLR